MRGPPHQPSQFTLMPQIPFFPACCHRPRATFTAFLLTLSLLVAHGVPAEIASFAGAALPLSLAHAAPERAAITTPPPPEQSMRADQGASPARPLDPALVGTTAVRPDLYWLLVPSEQSELADVLRPARRNAFSPWPSFWPNIRMEHLPRESGTLWLRFEIAPSGGPATSGPAADAPGAGDPTAAPDEAVPPALALDLNTRVFRQTAGRPQVWLVAAGATEGVRIAPTQAGLYPLPSHANQVSTIYIRTSGLPGPGFAPVVRQLAGADGVEGFAGARGLLVALAVGALLCLARGVAERREWRLWAALYALAVGVHAFWGLPACPTGVIPLWEMPGLLAPGVALLILPHVGRRLMRTREHAPYLDMQLILLALPGIPLMLVPLMPGYTWAVRYLPLWPLLILLVLPTGLAACMSRLPAARRFLLACLTPLLGLAAFLPQADALFDTLGRPERGDWLSLAPLAGLAASVLLLAFMRAPRRANATRHARAGQGERPDPARRPDGPKSFSHDGRHGVRKELRQTETGRLHAGTKAGPSAAISRLDMRPATVPPRVARPVDEPLSLTPEMEEPPLPLDPAWRQDPCPVQDSPQTPPAPHPPVGFQTPVSPHAPAGMDTRRAARLPKSEPGRPGTFDLQELMLKAHNSVAAEADARNLALSWFTAPYLPRAYEGDREKLAEVLHMLAESAVRATQRGAVHIRVQRVPESADPGHLLFTITDSGAGAPPQDRNPLALVRAWELVGLCGGSLSMESGPAGTSVSFSIRLAAHLPHAAAGPARAADRPSPSASERLPGGLPPRLPGRIAGASDTVGTSPNGSGTPLGSTLNISSTSSVSGMPETPRSVTPDDAGQGLSTGALRIILVGRTPANRRLLACCLEELPHEVLESCSAEEAQNLYSRSPGALLIFDDDIPEEDVVQSVAAIRFFEGEHNVPLASILALAGDEGKSERLRRAGCTHVLRTPVSRTDLRLLARRLAPVPRHLRAGLATETSPRPDARTAPHPAPRPVPRPVLRPDGASRPAPRGAIATQPTGSGGRPFIPATGEALKENEPLSPAAPATPAPMPAPTPAPVSVPDAPKAEERPADVRAEKAETASRPRTTEWRPLWNRTPEHREADEPTQAAETPRPLPGDAPKADPLPAPEPPAQPAPEGAEQTDSPREPHETPRPVQPRRSWKDLLFRRRAASPGTSPLAGTLSSPEQNPNAGPEWVGDPTPIVKPAPVARPDHSPAATAGRAPKPFVFSAPEDAVEWVGEPMPIIRPRPAAPETDETDRPSGENEENRTAAAPDKRENALTNSSRTDAPSASANLAEMPDRQEVPNLLPDASPAVLPGAPQDVPPDMPSSLSEDEPDLIDLKMPLRMEGVSPAPHDAAADLPHIQPPQAQSQEIPFREKDADWLRHVPDLSLTPQDAGRSGKPEAAQAEPVFLTERVRPTCPLSLSPMPQDARAAMQGEQSIADLASALDDGKRQILQGRAEATADAVIAGAGQIAAAAEGLALHTLADLARCVEEFARNDAGDDLRSLLDDLLTAVDRTLCEIESQEGAAPLREDNRRA